MMMYHVPIDMITRMTSVAFATQSLPRHSASRPYGFSTSAVDARSIAALAPAGVAGDVEIGAGVGGVAAGSGGVAGLVAVPGAAGAGVWPCASVASGMTAATAARMRTAADAARRVVFNMASP